MSVTARWRKTNESGPVSGAAGRAPAIARYLLSLPERVVRSAVGLAGGLAREIGEFTLPEPVRRTRLYKSLVDDTLRFLIEQVGQFEGVYTDDRKLAENFAVRRAAGNGLEWIGLATFRASPVWVLAALADLSGAGRRLVSEITATLVADGLLEPGAHFETVDQLLDGLERTSAHLAETVNTPPLDVAGLRREWDTLRKHVASLPSPALPPPDALWASWRALQQSAAAQQRSVFEVSSLVALSALRNVPERLRWLSRSAKLAAGHTGHAIADPLLEHYSTALAEIGSMGFLNYWAREYRPYLRAAAEQFSPGKGTWTQRFFS